MQFIIKIVCFAYDALIQIFDICEQNAQTEKHSPLYLLNVVDSISFLFSTF